MRVELIGRICQNSPDVTFHSHDYWEIIYYTDGSGNMYVNGQTVPFEAGDFFLIPPNTVHGEHSDGGFRNYHCIVTKFEINTRNYIKFHDVDQTCLQVIERMYLEFHMNRENRECILESLMQLLTQYIFSFMNTPQLNPYVSKAITTILENLSDPRFSLDDMIAEYPFHKNYFMRLFQTQVGNTPLQFLTERRINYAIQLMKTRKVSGLSLKEISQMTGYTDYYYFSRVFKKVTGVAPTAWEK